MLNFDKVIFILIIVILYVDMNPTEKTCKKKYIFNLVK